LPLPFSFLTSTPGIFGFGSGSGIFFAGRDHVELAWKQHHEPAGIVNAIGNASGIITGAPVEISARPARRSQIPYPAQSLGGERVKQGFVLSIAKLASMKNGVSIIMQAGQQQWDRPGVNGTPCAPTGSPSFDSPVTRKNT